jgi:probable O-glycosylation ligase (exosortase A-associated)
MRDILLAGVFFGLLTLVFQYPAMGVYLWAWVSLMNPHKMAFGFAHGLPFALTAAAVTFATLLLTRERRALPITAVTATQIALFVWMSLTSLFALNDASAVLDRWIFVAKIQVMMMATLMLVRDRRQIETLLWIVTLSVGFYGLKGGIWTLMTGGGGRVWGPPGGMIEGNNELAVALVMLIPFMYYLGQTATRRWIKYGIYFFLAMSGVSVLGSQSRGALLALFAMLLFLGFKGRHPVQTSLVLVAVFAAAINFMPDTWSNRMLSMQEYRQDNSSMSRLRTWETLFEAARDRPLVGVGFGADNSVVFDRYAPTGDEYEGFSEGVYVAHSIYFQVLGEHGFVGLAIFLLLGVTAWRGANRLDRTTRADPEFGSWVPLLMQMVRVSLIGYAVGGAFLSLAYFDLPYYVVAFVVLADAAVRDGIRSRSSITPEAAAAPDPSFFANRAHDGSR